MQESLKWRTPFSGATVPEDFLETPLIFQLKFAGISLQYHLLNREFQSFVFDIAPALSKRKIMMKRNQEFFFGHGILMAIHGLTLFQVFFGRPPEDGISELADSETSGKEVVIF